MESLTLEQLQTDLRKMDNRLARVELHLLPLMGPRQPEPSRPVPAQMWPQRDPTSAPPLTSPLASPFAEVPQDAATQRAPSAPPPIPRPTAASSEATFAGVTGFAPPKPPEIQTPVGAEAVAAEAVAAEAVGSQTVANEPRLRAEMPAPSIGFSLGEWENLIGGKWALWVGSLCLFLAMASFLALTWSALPPPPPWAKVAFGLGAGAAMLGASEWARSRSQRFYPEGLAGAGLSLCFLSWWAGGHYFSLFSAGQSFGGMAFFTALGVVLALRYDALSLSVISALGGFLTPVLLNERGGSGQIFPFLCYLAVLDAGILATATFKRWRGLAWLAFFATTLLLGVWIISAPISAFRLPIFGFWTLYFALFLGAACGNLLRREETAPEDLLLLFASSSLYAVAGWTLLAPISGGFPGAFAFGLAAFFGVTSAITRRIAPRDIALMDAATALGLIALTVGIALQWNGSALTCAWAAEAGALLFLGSKLRSSLLRRAGQIVWVLTAFPLGWELMAPLARRGGILSPGAGALAFCVLISAFAAWNARRISLANEKKDALEDGTATGAATTGAAGRDEFEVGYAAFAVFGGALWLGREILRGFALKGLSQLPDPTPTAIFAVAGALALYALGVFEWGARVRHQTTRVCALVLASLVALAALSTTFSGAPLELSTALAHWTPGWNPRFAAWIVIGGVLAVLGRALVRRGELSDAEKECAGVWIAGVAAWALIGVGVEIWSAFAFWRAWFGPGWTTLAGFALASLGMAAGALGIGLGIRWNQKPLRDLALALGAGALGAVLLLSIAPQAAAYPMFNLRFGAFSIAVLTLYWALFSLEKQGAFAGEEPSPWPDILRWTMLGLGLWALTQESYESCRYFQTELGTNWSRWAQMAISLVWSLCGALLLVGGTWRRSQSLRLMALGLLAATVVKVFLFDLGFLSGPARIFSLAGLGVSLVFISYLYSRFVGGEKGNEAAGRS